MIGDLEGPVAAVDRSGTVAPFGAGWRVGWAVGAGDRWRVASEEAAVRSHLVDGMPVVATAMKVPGGDVVQRVAAVRDAAGRAVVLEFVNEAPTPVSLAISVSGSISVAGVQAGRLVVDGRPAVMLGRAVGGAAAVSDGEVWPAVRAEPTATQCEARSPAGSAAAAAVIPLAPRVPLRAMVVVDGDLTGESMDERTIDEKTGEPTDKRVGGKTSAPTTEPVTAAAPHSVSAGWLAVVSRAAGADLGDESADRAWRRGIAAAVLAAGATDAEAAARASVVLDRVGLGDEGDRARAVVVGAAERGRLSPPVAAAALRALASRRLQTGRESGLADWAGPLAAAAGGCLDASTVEQVAAALMPEAPSAARDARGLLTDTARSRSRASTSASRSAAAAEPHSPHAGLGIHVHASRTGAAAEPHRRASSVGADTLASIIGRSVDFGGDGLAGIEALLDCLIAEAADHVVVAPSVPEPWVGAPIDAGSLVTRHGRLSFSLRWHGPRPAVLWEWETPKAVEAGNVGNAGAGPVLRCGLDPTWHSNAATGEALLRSP